MKIMIDFRLGYISIHFPHTQTDAAHIYYKYSCTSFLFFIFRALCRFSVLSGRLMLCTWQSFPCNTKHEYIIVMQSTIPVSLVFHVLAMAKVTSIPNKIETCDVLQRSTQERYTIQTLFREEKKCEKRQTNCTVIYANDIPNLYGYNWYSGQQM